MWRSLVEDGIKRGCVQDDMKMLNDFSNNEDGNANQSQNLFNAISNNLKSF